MSGKSQANVSHIANYTDNYGTATTTANKSMGFDLSATPSCCQAQLQLSAQLKAELALFPLDQATPTRESLFLSSSYSNKHSGA